MDFKIKKKNPNMLETLENKILIPLGINFTKGFLSLYVHINYNI